MNAREHLDDVERWHADRVASLTGPDGWLTVTGLCWLHEGSNSVGSAEDADVQLPRASARVGEIIVADGTVTARIDGDSHVTVEGSSAPPVLNLRTDRDAGGPTLLRSGSVTFYVISREGRLAVRAKDSESLARQTFHGIERYPVDPRWRIDARFERHAEGAMTVAPDVLGTTQTYRNPGTLRFEVDGTPVALEAFQEPDEDELFIVFGDATNGEETFAGGRYLYAKPPRDGRAIVDFNRAYNPPCVFTAYATCVLPVPENRLPVRIEAGEKRYGDH